MRTSTCFFLLLCSLQFWSQTNIVLDESFEDWENVEVFTDFDDYPGLDLLEIQVSNDEENIYFRFSIDKEVSLVNELQEHLLRFYLDTDQNPATGKNLNEVLGADFVFDFRNKTVVWYESDVQTGLSLNAFEFRVAPTVSTTEFEFAIDREAGFFEIPFFPNGSFSFALTDDAFGDYFIHDQNGELLTYTIEEPIPNSFEQINLNKQDNLSLRVLAYNVRSNGFNSSSALPSLKRILQSLAPDIIAISEAYDTTVDEIIDLLEEWFRPSKRYLFY